MGNPTLYLSLDGDYGRAEGDGIENGRFMVCGVNIRRYIEYFRVFIPPGTLRVMVEINDWLGQSVIVHHGTPPKSGFGQLPIGTSVGLKYLKDADRYFPGYAGTGKVNILYDGFASPYLSTSLAGWLYVKVDTDRYAGPEKYTNAVSITVDAAAYNDWYDNTDWQTDVEDVIEYSWGGAGGAENPTDYITLHDAYSQILPGTDGVLPDMYSFTQNDANAHGYSPQIRCFIPPGTQFVNLVIKDYSGNSGTVWSGGRKSVARHILLPDSSPEGDMPSEFIIGDFSTLTEMIDDECWSEVNHDSALNIVEESFSPPYLGIDKAGWLYVKVGGDSPQSYDTHFAVRVNSAVFNAWWTTYIKDTAGWNTLIEYVTTYVPPVPGISVSPTQYAVNKYAGTKTFTVSVN